MGGGGGAESQSASVSLSLGTFPPSPPLPAVYAMPRKLVGSHRKVCSNSGSETP